MISVYQLKSRFQGILRPITENLAKIGVTANQVTISAFLLSVATGAAIYYYAEECKYIFWLLPVALFIRMALNAIDGMLAREHNQKSSLGAILNELGDVLSDIVIYVPFLYVCFVNDWLIFGIAILALLSEMVGIMGIQIGASRHYDGPMGKSDRAFWFSILAMVLMYVPVEPNVLVIVCYVIIALLVYTIFNRLHNALKEVSGKEQ